MAEGSWSHQIERKTLEKAYERIDALEERVDLAENAISGWYRTANLREEPLTAPDIVVPADVADLAAENSELRLRISDLEEEIEYLREHGNL